MTVFNFCLLIFLGNEKKGVLEALIPSEALLS